MPAHKAPFDLHSTYLQYPDPGDAGTVTADRNLLYCSLVSAAAETRTLARPTVEGVFATLYLKTDGGDLTLTVTGGYNEAGDTTLVFDDAGQSATFISCYTGSAYHWKIVHTDAAGQGARNAEILTATAALTAADNGRVLFLNSGTEFATTLPAPQLGLRFTFIVAAAPASASYTVVTSASANILLGQVYTVDVNSATDPDFETTGGDTLTFVDAKAVVGDRADFFSDGTSWFVHAFCSVFDAITITGT
jgi:hypothetical protein